MKEIWKSVVGYEDFYSVSNLGRVRRDKAGEGLCKAGRMIKYTKSKTNYLRTCLCKYGVQKTVLVASIVADAFIGHKPSGYEINHIDGNKSNNNIKNLEYVTRSENIRHSFDIGIRFVKKGQDNHFAKLSEEQVILIRKSYVPYKNSYSKIGKKFNVSRSCINNIIRRKNWKHI